MTTPDPRVVLIGEAPGRGGSEKCHPLYPYPRTSAGGRLYALTPFYDGSLGGMRRYIDATIRFNIVPEYPGARRWPVDLARAQARNLLRSGVADDRVVVLVGRRVLEAVWRELYSVIGPDEARPCSIVYHCRESRYARPRADIGYLPHPSGRNRWYNDPDNARLARRFLEEVFDDA